MSFIIETFDDNLIPIIDKHERVLSICTLQVWHNSPAALYFETMLELRLKCQLPGKSRTLECD